MLQDLEYLNKEKEQLEKELETLETPKMRAQE
jgi:hypothetical protein